MGAIPIFIAMLAFVIGLSIFIYRIIKKENEPK